MDKTKKTKMWVGLAGLLLLAADQQALTEINPGSAAAMWLRIGQAVLIAGTTYGIWRVPNKPVQKPAAAGRPATRQ